MEPFFAFCAKGGNDAAGDNSFCCIDRKPNLRQAYGEGQEIRPRKPGTRPGWEDEETLAGIEDADAGRVVSAENAREHLLKRTGECLRTAGSGVS